MNNSLNLNGGVLIIGSLFWQINRGSGINTIRRDWRTNYLDMNSRILVRAPIRYGRVSGDGTYTMTFANSARTKPGNAWAVPFLQNPVASYPQLLRQAQELSYAEGMDRRFIKTTNDIPWSVLGILFNEHRIAAEGRQQLTGWWKSQLAADSDYRLFHHTNFKLGTEKPCILQNGILNVPWITTVTIADEVKLRDYDFLIATATLPTNRKYPSISKMAGNVKADTRRNYFMNNHQNNITTFQDARILKKIDIANE